MKKLRLLTTFIAITVFASTIALTSEAAKPKKIDPMFKLLCDELDGAIVEDADTGEILCCYWDDETSQTKCAKQTESAKPRLRRDLQPLEKMLETPSEEGGKPSVKELEPLPKSKVAPGKE